MTAQRSGRGTWVLAALIVSLAGCHKQPPWGLRDVSGIVAPLEFHLTDNRGRAVTAADYRGDVTLLYFGYTHCPDICPATLGKLAQALHALGADAARVRVLFITVDPPRDTVAVLSQYVTAFGPQFVGLRGDERELEAVARRFRVAYNREAPDTHGNYAVAHSSAVFVFDQSGEARLLADSGTKASAIAQDLRRLLAAGARDDGIARRR
jgi:protein SCO1